MIRKLLVCLALLPAVFLATAATAPAVTPDAAVSAKAKKKTSNKKSKKSNRKSGKKARNRLTVTIAGVGQNQLLRQRVLKVRVKSARRGKLKVQARSTTFDRRGKFFILTKARRPKFKRAGQTRVVKLPLRPNAFAQITSCEDRDIQAQAGKVRSKIKSLVRQSACAPRPLDLSRADRCDFIVDLDPTLCMAPFPNNFYTRGDGTTETGRRINFHADAMPKNASGTPIDPAPFNQSDGFSQGQGIVLRVPGLDNAAALAQTNPVTLADPARYLDPNAPVIVLNSVTGERHPIWVEIDSNASTSASTTLKVHPMVNYDSAGRYIVVLRNLKDSAGNILEAPAGFRYYRDILPSTEPRINLRRSYFEDIFRRLRNAGVARRDLYLAWDFNVASDENNTGRALSIRNQAFAELGDSNLEDRTIPPASTAPQFTVDSTEIDPNPQIVRRIEGTYEVPCYLRNPGQPENCGPGATYNLNAEGVPVKTGTWTANFECIVPHAVVDAPGAEPGRPLLYGHGLMGNIAGEINAGPQRDLADEYGFVICGTDEIGMSSSDIVPVAQSLADMSKFPKVADRLQQGLLNELYLTRLMIHPDGLASDPQFRVDTGDPESAPVIQTGGRAYYRGNSQGGIMGGALTALSPDFDRAALGVSAMNYSVLLTRSAAWSTYSQFFNPSYPDQAARPLVLGLAQMLWDRGEPNGYAHRMTGTELPGSHEHKVLMDIAFGDHLVTNWQSNVMARTVGARAVNPFVYSGRWAGVDGQWGIEAVPSYPYDGSAIAYWDSGPLRADPGNPGGFLGNPPPPIPNVAPNQGLDPHEDPRRADTANQMISEFLKPNGRVTNPCVPGACYAGEFTGP